MPHVASHKSESADVIAAWAISRSVCPNSLLVWKTMPPHNTFRVHLVTHGYTNPMSSPSLVAGHEDSLDVPAKYLLELMHIPEAGGMSRAKFTHMIEHALTLQVSHVTSSQRRCLPPDP